MSPDEQSVHAQELKPALAARFYSSADVFRLETERIFHSQWFSVGRADQIPAKGDCLHVAVAGESVVVVRGRDDALRAFYNVCRHRGSQLIRTPVLPDVAVPEALHSGQLNGAFVCPYHAWTYNLDGTLRAAPFVRFDADCPKDRFSLVPVHLDTWGGFIFVNLASQPPLPLLEQLAEPVHRLVRYPLQDLRRGAQLVYDVRANWNIVEAFLGPVEDEFSRSAPHWQKAADGSVIGHGSLSLLSLEDAL